jgi:uncharacterized protein
MHLYHNYLKKYRDVVEFTRQHLQKTAANWPPEDHPWALPEHRMEHTRLVLKNSLMLAVNRKVDLDVVALSAILHDIVFYSPKRKEHAEEGAKVAEKYLTEQGYPNDTVQKVVHSVKVHAGPLAFTPRSMEAKILQDADTIDKVGAIAIATFLLYYGSKKMMPKQAIDEMKKEMRRRLRWYCRTMNTTQGKRIVGERCEYIRTFIKKLEREME